MKLRDVVLAAAAALLACAGAGAAEWRPERAGELVVTAGPGGNQDLTARLIQKIWSDASLVPSSVVVNKPGGGGGIAYTYLTQRAGDPHCLLMLAPTMFTTNILGRNTFEMSEVTPIALLFNEYIFVSVRADSPIRSGRDLIARLKADPASLSVAVASALANHIHMGIAVPMKAAGVDVKKMKVVAFKSSEQSLTSLLGGHIDVAASTFGTVRPLLEAGKIRVIAVSAPQRLGGALATIPTWKEQGANGVFDSWRGIVGAKDLTASQAAYWMAAVEAVTRTDEWKEDLERNHRIGNFMKGADAATYWREQYAELEDVLNALGLARNKPKAGLR